MKLTLEEQTPMLDFDIPVILKARNLITMNQLLSRTYDEDEGLRETLGPILQEIKAAILRFESSGEWDDIHRWDSDMELLEKAAKKQKKHLKRVKEALLKGRNLRITYMTPGTGALTRRTIIPQDLWATESVWILRAYCYMEGEEHTFRVDRMLKAKVKPPSKRRGSLQLETLTEVPSLFAESDETANTVSETGTDELSFDDSEASEDLIFPEAQAELAQESLEDQGQECPENEPESEPQAPEASTQSQEISQRKSAPRHYSLPGKKPHQPGLPNRLDRLIKRVEKKLTSQ